MSRVVDLLAHRQRRGEPVIRFASASDALAYATTQVRELQTLAGSKLVLTSAELDLPLSQAAAVLDECTRLHAELRNRQETS
jgi:hypothetical protein